MTQRAKFLSERNFTDLNKLAILRVGGKTEPQRDFSAKSGNVTCYFKNLESRLIGHIEQAGLLIGCVAWLTNTRILNALARKRNALIVSKEDLWRPDIGRSRYGAEARLRALYQSLGGSGLTPLAFTTEERTGPLSFHEQRGFVNTSIRCVGTHSSGERTTPRAHHKFLVFCDYRVDVETDEEGNATHFHPAKVRPYAVWTGSFNFTHNASRSFENAVYIEDEKIAQAYVDEYVQLLALSESLDWESECAEPDMRICG